MKKILILAALFVGCSKEKEEVKPSVSKATYNIYVESGHATFKCKTVNGWVNESVNSTNNTLSFDVSENDLEYISQLISDTVKVTDSIHLIGTYNGVVKAQGYRSKVKGSVINVRMQLSK